MEETKLLSYIGLECEVILKRPLWGRTAFYGVLQRTPDGAYTLIDNRFGGEIRFTAASVESIQILKS